MVHNSDNALSQHVNAKAILRHASACIGGETHNAFYASRPSRDLIDRSDGSNRTISFILVAQASSRAIVFSASSAAATRETQARASTALVAAAAAAEP